MRAIAAGEIEEMVVNQMRRLIKAPEIRARVLREADTDDLADGAAVGEALDRLDAIWDELFPPEQVRLMRLLVERVEVSTEGARLRLHAAGLKTVIAEIAPARAAPKRRTA